MKPPTIQYPECEKMAAIADKSQVIGEFIEWLEYEKEWVICKQCGSGDKLFPVNFSTEELLAEFFKIDLNKVEKERRRMLKKIREKK